MRTKMLTREELIAILRLDGELRRVKIFLSRLDDAKIMELVAIPADLNARAMLECPPDLVRSAARDYALTERSRLLAELREYGFDLSGDAADPAPRDEDEEA